MSWDQLRLFDPPDPELALEPVHLRLAAEFPSPGYDHVVVDMVNDALARLSHDQGLFPNRVAIDIELDHIDCRYFDDTSTTGADNVTTADVNAPIRRHQRE